MFKRILVPLDGSLRAEQALPVAARLARASGRSLVLLRVVDTSPEHLPLLAARPTLVQTVGEADRTQAESYLNEVASSEHLTGISVEIMTPFGPVAPTILSTAASQQADVIVLCSHGYTSFKRWALGSIAQKVARHAPVPVLVLHQHATLAGPHTYMEPPLRVLVPLDGSVLAKAALKPAAQLVAALAAPGQGAIHLMRVVKQDTLPGEVLDPVTKEHLLHKAKNYLTSLSEHMQEGVATELKLTVTWSVALDTDAADAIIGVAENGEDAEGAGVPGRCNFIALATHGRAGLQRWAMGSVAERVLAGTTLPVLIVRVQPPATEQAIHQEEAKQTEVQV